MTKTYKVVKGDTLFEIAKANGVSLDALEAANPGVKPENLAIGQTINIPEKSGGGSSGGSGGSSSGTIPGSTGGTNGGGGYVNYSGPASAFPNPNQWQKYSLLWDSNSKLMKFHDSDAEIKEIHTAIETVAKESGIDVRVILCTIMQESGGNVRIPTTDNGVRNPGLMQSHNGVAFDPAHPAQSILQMVRDGTEGTKSGDGLKQLHTKYGNYYEAFRGYNSGQVNKNQLNDPMGATANYVKDIANRLMGHKWDNM